MITIGTVHRAVCKFYDVSIEYPFQPNRKRDVISMRQLIHFLAKKYTTKYLSEIGQYWEARVFDHSTILHSINTIQDRLDVERAFRNQVEELILILDRIKETEEMDFETEREVVLSLVTKSSNKRELTTALNTYIEMNE